MLYSLLVRGVGGGGWGSVIADFKYFLTVSLNKKEKPLNLGSFPKMYLR